MSQVYASGKVGSVLIGSVAYGFKDWSIDMDGKTIETSNFVSGAYRQYTMGLIGATISFTAPYDVGPAGSGGDMPLTIDGSTKTFTLGVNASVSIIVPAIINKIGVKQEIDGIAMLTVNAQVTGSFSALVV